MRPDLALLIAAYRIAWREGPRLAPLFFGFALLTDAILTPGGMGTLLRAAQGLTPWPLDGAISGSMHLLGLCGALVVLVFLLPVELVWFLALMQRIRGMATPSITVYLRERYLAAFRGFTRGLGWLLLMGLGLSLILAVLMLGLRGGLGAFGNGLLGLAAAGAAFGIAVFVLPYVFSTYRCILDAPIPFDDAFALVRANLRGRRVGILVTLALACLPNAILALLPLPAGVPWAFFALLGGALLSVPVWVLTYLYQERFSTIR